MLVHYGFGPTNRLTPHPLRVWGSDFIRTHQKIYTRRVTGKALLHSITILLTTVMPVESRLSHLVLAAVWCTCSRTYTCKTYYYVAHSMSCPVNLAQHLKDKLCQHHHKNPDKKSPTEYQR